MRALLAGDEGGGAAATYASVTTTDAETNDPMDQKRQRKACGDTTAIQRVTEQHNGVCQPPRSKRDPPAVSTNAGHTASAAATVPCALTSQNASLHLAIEAWWAHFSHHGAPKLEPAAAPARRAARGACCMINLHSYVSHTHGHFTYFFTYSRVYIVHAPLEAGAAGPCTAGLCPALGGRVSDRHLAKLLRWPATATPPPQGRFERPGTS